MTGPSAVAVIGAGSFGTCLAVHAARIGLDATLWARDPEVVRHIRRYREHPRRLRGVNIPDGVHATHDLDEALSVGQIIHAIPVQQTRAFWQEHRDRLPSGATILLAAKGLERDTGLRLDEVFAEVFGEDWVTANLAALSGPTFAAEVAAGVPSVALIAAFNEALAEAYQILLAGPTFRLYRSTDLIGVEVAGAFKNVIAIAAGVSDGLGLGLNSRAAIIARGLAEMTRFGVAQGAERDTFSGLAGVGDLVLTATGELSRNRTVGYRLGQGDTLEDILAEMSEVAEGVPTTASVVERARQLGVEIPIAEQIWSVLANGNDPRQAVHTLMTRSLKREY
ncbi:MAG: NAD(P)-dependent glycerol-3-phosphate dehydrogenase [Candidatus Dadabacteria bacterium]|nr:MAG: NAD(P)-dependent glycerol-3-phosphate dehydrogenase [Candidatus Dadabacteria bacterium]